MGGRELASSLVWWGAWGDFLIVNFLKLRDPVVNQLECMVLLAGIARRRKDSFYNFPNLLQELNVPLEFIY